MVSIDFTKKWYLSDVALKTKDSADLLHANKAILAAYSPFFHKMLFGSFSESKQDVVNLEGIDYWPMLEILKILHNVDRRFDEAIPLYSPDKFTQLWKTADGYDIPLIRQLCKQQMTKFKPPQALEAAILCEFHEEKSKILELMSAEEIQTFLKKDDKCLVFSQADAAIIAKKCSQRPLIFCPRIFNIPTAVIEKPPLVSIDFVEKWEMSDIVLKMKDGEVLFANKAVLAVHSSFFKTLFFADSEKSKQEVVELKDIDVMPFLQILEIIHRVEREFDEATPLFPVQDLVQFWKIAIDYNIPLIRDLCMQQIPKLPPADGLETAIKCGLHDEKTEILNKMSFEDVENYLTKGITEFVFTPVDTLVIIEKRKEIEETRVALVEQALEIEKKKTEQAINNIKALEAEKRRRHMCKQCKIVGTPQSSVRYYCKGCGCSYTP